MTPAEIAAMVAKLTPPPPAGSPHALPIAGSQRPNRTAVYRHWRFRDVPLLEAIDPAHQTFDDLFEFSVRQRGNGRMLGWRPWDAAARKWEDRYVWMSYREAAERRKNIGAGIVEVHHRAGVTADKYGVGLWAQNRPEWQLVDLGLISQSLWTVSLYETLGPEASEFIINHGELACVVASLPHVPALLQLAARVPSLKLIISLDPLDAGEPAGCSKVALLGQLAKERGVQLYSLADVEEIGARSGRPMRPPRGDDIITVNYTSGTTGDPKGVVLTHANIVAATACSRCSGNLGPADTHISYLPLAHIYGRLLDQLAISLGAHIGYFHGDVLGLVDDMKILRPTGFFSVPRLFNRFSSTIQAATVEAAGVRGALSKHVIRSKKAAMRLPPGKATNRHVLFDRVWTPKVRQAVGLDRVHTMVSGSAQLDPDVHEFLSAAFACHFFQGYGLTETCAVGTVQLAGDYTTGTIGPPNPSVEMCLESVPDMEYCVDDKPRPRGELLMRGPIIFREYFKSPDETRKALDPDGWFHTGDIAEVDSLGRFSIIDRKKNVLKLAQGEYISPERIENVYMGSCNLVATAFVHGDSKESTLVAVFGVDPEHFAPFASAILDRAVSPADVSAVKAAAQDPKVKQAFLQTIDRIGKKHKFNSYERVRNCKLDVEPFTIDNELLTPTLKLKRQQCAKRFRPEIDQMYSEIRSLPSSARPRL